MSDDPVLTALAHIKAELSRIEAEQSRLRQQINDKLDAILNRCRP